MSRRRTITIREGILVMSAPKALDTPDVRKWMQECSTAIENAYIDMLIFGSGRLDTRLFGAEHDAKLKCTDGARRSAKKADRANPHGKGK
jgi:hypothetical protein